PCRHGSNLLPAIIGRQQAATPRNHRLGATGQSHGQFVRCRIPCVAITAVNKADSHKPGENLDIVEPATGSMRLLVPLALLAVYVVWGSTYLAIRVALDSWPPFLLGAVRFLAAGGALYAFLRLRGMPAPTRQQWRNAA